MKIAILTQPLGKNYGGILQAFALQKLIMKMGHDVVTIDRQYNQPSSTYKVTRTVHRIIKIIIGRRRAPINFEKNYPHIFENPNKFIQKYMKMSELIATDEMLRKHFEINHYDVAIVGSDQTWRPKYSPNIYSFFLDFIDNPRTKKIAYATSFGVDQWEFTKDQTLVCRNLVKAFQAVSVREKSGIDLCHNYLNIDAHHVLDPTLLLTKNDYLNLLEEIPKDIDGVFTYWLDESPEKINLSNSVAHTLNTHSFKCQAKCSIGNEQCKNLDDYLMPPIEDWIASFAKAKFVLTDSFHGMVFSILFNKPFFVVVNEIRGGTRFSSLLLDLGLESRMFTNPQEISSALVKTDINWDAAIPNLISMRETSYKFLIDSLEK